MKSIHTNPNLSGSNGPNIHPSMISPGGADSDGSRSSGNVHRRRVGSPPCHVTLLILLIVSIITGLAGPSAIILGGALAMSSTAVGIQVFED